MFSKQKLYPSFMDNKCGVDLADRPLISRHNKAIRLMLMMF